MQNKTRLDGRLDVLLNRIANLDLLNRHFPPMRSASNLEEVCYLSCFTGNLNLIGMIVHVSTCLPSFHAGSNR